MIELDYYRWEIFRSKLVLFGKKLPSPAGYHFLICENCYSELPYDPSFIPKKKQTTIIDLTKEVDDLLKQMKKGRRKVIKDGLKIGYQIVVQKANVELLNEFKTLFNRFIPLKGATPLVSLNYFKALMPYMTVFKGIYEGRTLKISLVMHDGQIVKGFYQARDESITDRKLRKHIGSVVHWEIMMHFKRLGYQILDFGGLVEGHPDLNYYKLSFRGEVIPVYDYDAALTLIARAAMSLKKMAERNLRQFTQKESPAPQIIQVPAGMPVEPWRP